MIINLTPHAISLADDAGAIIRTIPASGNIARVDAKCVDTNNPVTVANDSGKLIAIPVFKNTAGTVSGLPEPKDGVSLLVSGFVLAACPSREDLLAPDTSPTGNCVRNDKGQIVAVRRFLAA